MSTTDGRQELTDAMFGGFTRLEVIGPTGRELTRWNTSIQPSIQDEGEFERGYRQGVRDTSLRILGFPVELRDDCPRNVVLLEKRDERGNVVGAVAIVNVKPESDAEPVRRP